MEQSDKQQTSAEPAPRSGAATEEPVLRVDGLKVCFHTEDGTVWAVDGVEFDIGRGRILGLVGESGCGKSVTAYSILRLIQNPGEIAGGCIEFRPSRGEPLEITALEEDDERLYQLRGGAVSMIFQEPMTALSPVHTVGNQLCEAILLHQDVTPAAAEERAVAMLREVGIPGAETRIHQYPFELSGGMRQRVVIAMALVCNPEVLIADEPTTALDVTIQAQILGLMKRLQSDRGTSILLITHDLGVVAQMADDVAVMYLGRIVETASVRTVMKNPRHPYTMGLLASLPSLNLERGVLPSIRGSVPSIASVPSGCPFHPRCPHSKPGVCNTGGPPALRPIADGHRVACVRAEEIPAFSVLLELGDES